MLAAACVLGIILELSTQAIPFCHWICRVEDMNDANYLQKFCVRALVNAHECPSANEIKENVLDKIPPNINHGHTRHSASVLMNWPTLKVRVEFVYHASNL